MNAANRSCIMSWEDLTVQNFREAFLKFLSGYIATLILKTLFKGFTKGIFNLKIQIVIFINTIITQLFSLKKNNYTTF
jgi:hypothetical protein